MPNNVLYYNDVVTLCDAAGDYVRTKSLLNDLLNTGYTSPKSVKVLAEYYDGDIEILKDRHKDNMDKANNAWFAVRSELIAEGRWDKSDGELMLSKLQMATDYCDFRTKLRDWARSELKKEEKLAASKNESVADGKKKAPKGATFYDCREFLDRYQRLILKRQKEEKK